MRREEQPHSPLSDLPILKGSSYNQHRSRADSEPGNNRVFLSEDVKTKADDTPGLKECMHNVPRLTGCEAAYFFPVGVNVCNWNGTDDDNDTIFNGTDYHDDKTQVTNPAPSFKVNVTVQPPRSNEGIPAKDGNLVIHVRSGDIFSGKGAYGAQHYGQVSTLPSLPKVLTKTALSTPCTTC